MKYIDIFTVHILL